MDYLVHAILHARILEWVAIPFSKAFSQPRVQTPALQEYFTCWATREALYNLIVLNYFFLPYYTSQNFIYTFDLESGIWP